MPRQGIRFLAGNRPAVRRVSGTETAAAPVAA